MKYPTNPNINGCGVRRLIQTRLRTICPVALALLAAASVQAGDSCEPQWDNTIGQPGMDLFVFALAMFDDNSGSGPALYASGFFTTAGGVPANRIAKWDGQTWSALGSGMEGIAPVPQVMALTVFDDGSGPALYAGGSFTTAGGVEANNIAKWDGTSWSAVGSGVDAAVRSLAVFDDGSGGGPALYAGGFFTTAGGVPANRIAKWDGQTWSALGSGVGNGVVACLAVFDDAPGSGAGPALFAGGDFVTAGDVPANRIAKWDGAKWSPLGDGMNDHVAALTVLNRSDGAGPVLVAGGFFSNAGGVNANRIAQWDGSSWSPIGGGVSGDEPWVWVSALAEVDDPSEEGPALLIGGAFSNVGGVSANRIARWDGEQWSALGSGTISTVRAILGRPNDPQNNGAPSIYVGGIFTEAGGLPSHRIAQWRECPEKGDCLPRDFNCDGTVGVFDLVFLLANWGPCPNCDTFPCDDCGPCPADLTGDCIVGVADLIVLLAKWG